MGNTDMIRAAVVGGAGYTGLELARLLLGHPRVALACVVSRTRAGEALASEFPAARRHLALRYSASLEAADSDPDVVFFATPNGVAMHEARELLASGVRVIDLAADFRLADADEWRRWYGCEHACPELLADAVYGLPELHRDAIRGARLVANPGCYPTSVILGFKPALEALQATGADVSCLIADSKSGVSGAGRRAQSGLLFGECSENFKAYKASAHRHWPEIKQRLDALAGIPTGFSFTPHLLPSVRGIHSTLYFRASASPSELQECFEQAYANEPFVEVLPAGGHPQTRWVRGGNVCLMAVHKPPTADVAKVLVVIDNLVKGAAGQAVQNMNLMFGLDEELGLRAWSPVF